MNKNSCHRAGPLTRNGFLNFMREFRKRNCGMNIIAAAKAGARCWATLTCEQKEKYKRLGYPKKKRRSCKSKPLCPPRKRKSCARPPRATVSCRPKKKPACKKRIKCTKPGPPVANAYLLFVRQYRRKHCGLKPNELISKAAQAWCRLSEDKKMRYRRMACKLTKSCQHKNRSYCRY